MTRPVSDVCTGPLAHLRVLDLSRVLAGPWATQTLADLGAEVLKVERPGAGDDTRGWGPPWLGGDAPRDDGMSAYFLACNRNKRSLVVDITSEEGAALLRRLAATADVVVENFKPGALDRYGLGPAQLLALQPRLVVCSITGFGHTGPMRDRAGYDLMIQALGGLMSVTGAADGPPMKTGVAVADLMTGMYACTAILAALAHRDRTGEGQHIDLALLDTQVAWLANQATNHLSTGRPPGRMGNAHPNLAPYEVFEAADGWFVLAVGNDAQFAAFAKLAGHPEWSGDERFRTNTLRVQHRGALVPLVAAALRTQPRAVWITRCEAAGVPCGSIRDLGEVFDDPHVLERGGLVEQPVGDTLARTPGNPIKLSATPVSYRHPPPRLGEGGDELVARWLGEG